MALTIKLPAEKAKEEYSIYVNGKIILKYTDSELGTLLKIEGTGIAFYSASNTRRAIIFQELTENSYSIPLIEGTVPYVKEKVRILYKAKGRKVDLLKFMVFNLEKKYKTEIYELGTLYWLTLGSFIDALRTKDKGSKKEMGYLITEKYIMMRKRLNENR